MIKQASYRMIPQNVDNFSTKRFCWYWTILFYPFLELEDKWGGGGVGWEWRKEFQTQ